MDLYFTFCFSGFNVFFLPIGKCRSFWKMLSTFWITHCWMWLSLIHVYLLVFMECGVFWRDVLFHERCFRWEISLWNFCCDIFLACCFFLLQVVKWTEVAWIKWPLWCKRFSEGVFLRKPWIDLKKWFFFHLRLFLAVFHFVIALFRFDIWKS